MIAESAGIGLRNCRERLALVYGDKATLTLTPMQMAWPRP